MYDTFLKDYIFYIVHLLTRLKNMVVHKQKNRDWLCFTDMAGMVFACHYPPQKKIMMMRSKSHCPFLPLNLPKACFLSSMTPKTHGKITSPPSPPWHPLKNYQSLI